MRLSHFIVACALASAAHAQTTGPLNVGNGIQFSDGANLAVSPTGKARVRYHLGLNRLEMSLNGSGWTAVGGGGGGGSTLNAAYAAGATQADSTLQLDNTRGGFKIVDALAPITTFPFSVEANSGFYIYLGADKSGIWSNMPSLTGDILPQLLMIPGSHTAMTASTEVINYRFTASPWQWNAGALTVERWMHIERPTISFTSASTVGTAATVEIEGAPLAGTNATITNPYALNVASGLTRLAGSVITPSIGSFIGSFHALPTGTDDIVTTDATQTLTNKTITAPVLSGTATGTYTLGGTPTLGSDVTGSSGVDISLANNGVITSGFTRHNSSAPSCTLGPVNGTGGSPSCTVTGNQHFGKVLVTTGNVQGTCCDWFTLTFSATAPNGWSCTFTAANVAARGLDNRFNNAFGEGTVSTTTTGSRTLSTILPSAYHPTTFEYVYVCGMY